jgi:hypothetical protein
MSARALNRMRSFGRAALSSIRLGPRTRPANPRRILVVTSCSWRHADAGALLRACAHATVRNLRDCEARSGAAFSGRLHGVMALPFTERNPDSWQASRRPRRDLAIVPGENPISTRARSAWMGRRVGGARPAGKLGSRRAV